MSRICLSSRRAIVTAQRAIIFRQGDGFAVRLIANGQAAIVHGEDGYPLNYGSPREAEADLAQFRVTTLIPVETDIGGGGLYLP